MQMNEYNKNIIIRLMIAMQVRGVVANLRTGEHESALRRSWYSMICVPSSLCTLDEAFSNQ
jgi:hypothetical protein